MATRSNLGPTRDDDDDIASPEFTRWLVIGMAIAALIGLTCGVTWTLYHLTRQWLN